MSKTATQHRTRLEQIIELEGRKQTWLAEQVGVSRSRLSQFVGGYHVPDDLRAPIAEALGRTVADVFPERWPA